MPKIVTCNNGLSISVYSIEDCISAPRYRITEEEFSGKDFYVIAQKIYLRWPCDSAHIFDSAEDAAAYYTSGENGYKDYIDDYLIRRILWKELARHKYIENTERLLVWRNSTFWNECALPSVHFTAPAEKDGRLVAYYDNEDKARRDIRTVCRPGRYLSKFFADILSEKQIAFYATWQATGNMPADNLTGSKAELRFAETPDEIENVYLNGPESCMSHGVSDYSSHPMHPVRVYGAGDLAVAYLHEDAVSFRKPILARAVVWPDKKLYGRVYPTPDYYRADGYKSSEEASHVQRLLHDRLIESGYSQIGLKSADDNFDGARLLRISVGSKTGGGKDTAEGGEAIVMPYLDGGYGFLDDEPESGFVRMSRKLERKTGCSTSGLVVVREPPYGICGHCAGILHTREHARYVCADIGPYGGCNAVLWCSSCVTDNAETFHCAGYDAFFFRSTVESVMVEGNEYSARFAQNNFFVSDRSGEWAAGSPMRMYNGDRWGAREVGEHAYCCPASGEYYPNDVPRHADDSRLSSLATDAQVAAYVESHRARSERSRPMTNERTNEGANLTVPAYYSEDNLNDALRRVADYGVAYATGLSPHIAYFADAVREVYNLTTEPATAEQETR